MSAARDRVARVAIGLVEPGMIVGLGTGDTARRFIEQLAQRAREEALDLTCVATSDASAEFARTQGLVVRSLREAPDVDLAVDGADEVDPRCDLIKGGGGAHTREKIVAASARSFVVLVDESKLVETLGVASAVPLEVLLDAVSLVERRVRALGASPSLRKARGGGPEAWITDLGHVIVDAKFPRIDEPATLSRALDAIPGVVGHGLSVGMTALVLVGELNGDRVRRLVPGPGARAEH
jgi:ribose 5-phosphate isomerase A